MVLEVSLIHPPEQYDGPAIYNPPETTAPPVHYAGIYYWATHSLYHATGLNSGLLAYGPDSMGLYPVVLFNEGDWRADLELLDPDPLLMLINTGVVGRQHDPILLTTTNPRASILNHGTFNGDIETAPPSTTPGWLNITTEAGSVWRGNIYADETELKLVVKGTFRGNVFADGEDDDVFLSGTLRGDLHLGAGDDLVRNAGTHIGATYLGDGDDTYIALPSINASFTHYVYGGSGADTLTGGAFADALFGGADADRLTGGSGNDRLTGNDGDDWLWGNLGADLLIGDHGNDWLAGGHGPDALQGNAHHDILVGGRGNDDLSGGSGHDALYGGAGADRLLGGTGNDLLTGGGNSDEFVFMPSHNGHDRITDFTADDHIAFERGSATDFTESLLRARLPKALFQDGDDLRLDLSILYATASGTTPDASVLIEDTTLADLGTDTFIFHDF